MIKVGGKEKEYTIVGAQEANPLQGKISNESPLGSSFLGKKKEPNK
jgi:transcription elongation factor GreA